MSRAKNRKKRLHTPLQQLHEHLCTLRQRKKKIHYMARVQNKNIRSKKGGSKKDTSTKSQEYCSLSESTKMLFKGWII